MKFVLSGGGVRGFAHVGVLQAFREHDIVPEAIAGTSAGSIVGAFIADGFTPEEIRELFVKKLGLSILFEWSGWRSQLLSLKKFGEFMRQNLRHKRLEELPIPLYITATNYHDGRQTIFSSGDIVEKVLAASSIPGIFPPVFIDDIPYVDGGLVNNLPVEPFADCKPTVVAVYVNPIAPFNASSSMIQTMDRAAHLSFVRSVASAAEGCHLYIEPPELHRYSMFDVQKLAEIYKLGYDYTKGLLEKKGL